MSRHKDEHNPPNTPEQALDEQSSLVDRAPIKNGVSELLRCLLVVKEQSIIRQAQAAAMIADAAQMLEQVEALERDNAQNAP